MAINVLVVKKLLRAVESFFVNMFNCWKEVYYVQKGKRGERLNSTEGTRWKDSPLDAQAPEEITVNIFKSILAVIQIHL